MGERHWLPVHNTSISMTPAYWGHPTVDASLLPAAWRLLAGAGQGARTHAPRTYPLTV